MIFLNTLFICVDLDLEQRLPQQAPLIKNVFSQWSFRKKGLDPVGLRKRFILVIKKDIRHANGAFRLSSDVGIWSQEWCRTSSWQCLLMQDGKARQTRVFISIVSPNPRLTAHGMIVCMQKHMTDIRTGRHCTIQMIQLLMTQKEQTKWIVNSVMHRLRSMLILGPPKTGMPRWIANLG